MIQSIEIVTSGTPRTHGLMGYRGTIRTIVQRYRSIRTAEKFTRRFTSIIMALITSLWKTIEKKWQGGAEIDVFCAVSEVK